MQRESKQVQNAQEPSFLSRGPLAARLKRERSKTPSFGKRYEKSSTQGGQTSNDTSSGRGRVPIRRRGEASHSE